MTDPAPLTPLDPVATIRTAVPAAVGALLSWVARRTGVVVDEDTSFAVMGAAVVICTAAYHIVVRVVERHVPWAGWFLGVARQPVYLNPATAVVRHAPARLRQTDDHDDDAETERRVDHLLDGED